MRKTLLSVAAVMATLIIVGISNETSISNPNGAPSGRSGSPSDGATCFSSGCHFGAPTTQAGMITSTIPASGYVPGTTYTITAAITGNNKKGFQVSPQNASGSAIGTLIAGTGSQVLSGKWITHSIFVSSGTATATWNFQWTAPPAGTGAFTFYGAFANSRGTTKVSTLDVIENTATGIDDISIVNGLSIFPMPAHDILNSQFTLKQNTQVVAAIYGLDGRKLMNIANETLTAGNQQFELNDLNSKLGSGVFFIRIDANSTQLVKKIVVE